MHSGRDNMINPAGDSPGTVAPEARARSPGLVMARVGCCGCLKQSYFYN